MPHFDYDEKMWHFQLEKGGSDGACRLPNLPGQHALTPIGIVLALIFSRPGYTTNA
jgi:hypothetical protein